jgi:hypothetical protein
MTQDSKSQFYKTPFGVITSFFGVIYANFLIHKFERRNLRQNLCQKTAFCFILRNDNHFIGLKNGFGLITPMLKFWRWRSKF